MQYENRMKNQRFQQRLAAESPPTPAPAMNKMGFHAMRRKQEDLRFPKFKCRTKWMHDRRHQKVTRRTSQREFWISHLNSNERCRKTVARQGVRNSVLFSISLHWSGQNRSKGRFFLWSSLLRRRATNDLQTIRFRRLFFAAMVEPNSFTEFAQTMHGP